MHSSAVERRIADPEVAGSIPVAPFPSRLAQLVERKALNLVVVGSSPTVGAILILLTTSVVSVVVHSRVLNNNLRHRYFIKMASPNH